MNDKIKNQMLLNSESYQFFLNETRKAERKFFKYSALCGIEMERVSEDFEEQTANGLFEKDINLHRINLNIFSEAINQGKKFITSSNKFVTELQMMRKLSVNVMDDALDFGNDRVDFLEKYIESIDKSIEMQDTVSELISNEIEMLQGVVDSNPFRDDEDGDNTL